MTKQMKAWLVEEITPAGKLRLADVPLPVPGPNQYLIKVEAAGLNFLDTLVVQGRYQVKPALPFTPGIEVVGHIASPGDGAAELAQGSRVATSVAFGGFAQYALCTQADAVAIGDQVPAAAAMALRGNYPTSLYALVHGADLQPGETLLVHAGAGGVGSAAVQIGKALGARVIATAGGSAKVQSCLELGADEAIDYTADDWVARVRNLAPGGVEVIYDPVGGQIGEQSMRVLAFAARYLIIGFAGGALTSLAANRLLLQNASAVGVLWGVVRARNPELASRMVATCFDWYKAGRLKPLESSTFPFEQAPEALDALRGRSTTGKVVLTV